MLLSLEKIWTFYGNFPALHGVTLRGGPGEVVTLLGSNSGKKQPFSRRFPVF